MIYVTLILLVLTLVWVISVWIWLRANPVPPLSPIPQYQARLTYPALPSQNPIWGVMAATSVSYFPGVYASSAGPAYVIPNPEEFLRTGKL